MENVNEKIYSILGKIALEMGLAGTEFKIERPKDKLHGDFSSNIALVMFKALRSSSDLDDSSNASVPAKLGIRSPSATLTKTSPRQTTPRAFNSSMQVAEEIVKILNSKPARIATQSVAGGFLIQNSDFDKVEAATPGFINFYLSKSYLQTEVQHIIQQGQSYGSLSIGKGKRVSVEFVSANPTGPLHIGNARGGPLGDTIANVLTKAGFIVTREYLHNDVGGQVDRLGEAIYFTLHPDQISENYEVQYQGDYIKKLAEEVEESLASDDGLSQVEFIEKAGKVAVSLILMEILKDCEDMGIKYDKIRKESDLRKEVPQVLPKIKKFFKEKEGALWFAPASNAASPDEFLKDRETVIRKSNGQYTYFASDIVYHNEKMSQNDMVIDILGANHSGHEPRLKAVVKALGYDPDNLKVILYQWIRLKRGEEIVKMSKRAGTFVTAREVLDEVGEDAFRFFLLMQNSSTHMDFDLDLAKKKASDNPVFYVQYAYTRICSIFSRIQNEELRIKNLTNVDLELLKTEEEIDLIRKLIEFPYLVEEISKTFAVNNLCTYAMDLASEFHKFYEKHQVISKDKDLTQARLALLKATQITLKNTLDLLGVSAPEHM
jgi:arginyl-tRNA synthetase